MFHGEPGPLGLGFGAASGGVQALAEPQEKQPADAGRSPGRRRGGVGV